MEHQYPAAISGDENMLAELMLPDQAHARKEDWTIFFLHKDSSEADEPEDTEDAEEISKDNDSEVVGHDVELENEREDMDEDEEVEGPPLIYVLNLVNTKYDSTAKRYLDHGLNKYFVANPQIQRRHCQSHGNMHATSFSPYLQGELSV